MRELPEPVDLAIIVVPADSVLAVVDDCALRGAKALIVISAGFAEVNEEGRKLQLKLLEKVRGYGMRMVGPNCMGVINADPEIRMNASFCEVFPDHGKIAMSSQSGALGIAVMAHAQQRKLGLSTFVSVGNKADVSGNDLLQYWEQDASTDVILLYLESFGNPRRFARIARRVSHIKPIVAVKAGRTLAGRRAAGSHTAAMAASDVAVEALFHQTGVIRANTLEEMFDLALILGNQPLPGGRRIGIITNAGGPGILCSDACEAAGLVVPEFSAPTKKRLKTVLPDTASVVNPVDMIASATPEQYRHTVQAVLEAKEVDALIVIYILVVDNAAAVYPAIQEGVAAARKRSGHGKPVLACLMTHPIGGSLFQSDEEAIPTFAFPEGAARALGKIAAYAEWRKQPIGIIPDFDDIDPATARFICQKALEKRGEGWLSAGETRDLLKTMNLNLPPGGVALTPDEAVELARQIGFPVAIKLASSQIVHKTEAGGVHLNVPDEKGVREAFRKIHSGLAKQGKQDAMEGVIVQPMMAGGVEVMIGVTEDAQFGPLIAFGLGGIHVEILGDVCFQITPLTDLNAAEMIRSIKGYRLLCGYRGYPAVDIDALQQTLLRVSRLVEEVPAIKELDMNPIFAFSPGQSCTIADARIQIRHP